MQSPIDGQFAPGSSSGESGDERRSDESAPDRYSRTLARAKAASSSQGEGSTAMEPLAGQTRRRRRRSQQQQAQQMSRRAALTSAGLSSGKCAQA